MESFASGPGKKKYPFDKWSTFSILAIDLAINEAWNTLKSKNKSLIATGTETDINIKLHEEIYNIWENGRLEPFTDVYFESPVKGGEFTSYNDPSKELRPDIHIRLKRQQSVCLVSKYYDAFIIECKIIDKSAKKDIVRNYLGKGLVRFVDGRYSWAVTQAMMVAYIRDGSTYPDSFQDKFNDADLCDQYNLLLINNTISRHNRKWQYKGRKPGYVDIYHRWLNC